MSDAGATWCEHGRAPWEACNLCSNAVIDQQAAHIATLEARIAELTREHGEAMVTIATTASAGVATSDLASARAERDEAMELLRRWRGCLSATEAEVFALRNETSALLARLGRD